MYLVRMLSARALQLELPLWSIYDTRMHIKYYYSATTQRSIIAVGAMPVKWRSKSLPG